MVPCEHLIVYFAHSWLADISRQTYKIPRGDGYLQIIGELYQNASYSAEQIAESHEFWKELVTGDVDSNEINYNQTTMADLESYISPEDANDELDILTESDVEDAADVPEEALVWAYLDGNYELVEQGTADES